MAENKPQNNNLENATDIISAQVVLVVEKKDEKLNPKPKDKKEALNEFQLEDQSDFDFRSSFAIVVILLIFVIGGYYFWDRFNTQRQEIQEQIDSIIENPEITIEGESETELNTQ